METLTVDFVAWAAVIGTLLPLLISALKQSTWTSQVKKAVAVIVSVVAAVVYTGAAEGWNLDSFGEFWGLALASAAGIFMLAQASYVSFWEDTAIEVQLASLGDRRV